MVDKIWYNMEELIGGSEERGINRNILECKSLLDSQRPHQENRVLIETYWNVNCRQGDKAARDVLIGINRNILECKLRSAPSFLLYAPY